MIFTISAVLAVFLLIKIICIVTLGRCKSNTCLIGKTALVTGAYSGIGFQTALGLASRGCRLIIADKENCNKIQEKIIEETGNSNIITKYFDLSSLDSVRALAKDINETEERLDILINNAGTAGLENCYTKDGLHIGMQVNHFGSFLLTHLLVDLLKKSAPSRIIFVSSCTAYYTLLTEDTLNPFNKPASLYSNYFLYANTKLCNTISANGFAEKLKGTGVVCNSLHPGIVRTMIYKKFTSGSPNYILCNLFYFVVNGLLLTPFGKTAEEGAQTSLHLAVAKETGNVSGKFFADCRPFIMPFAARNRSFAERIWKKSEEYVKLRPEEKL